MTISIHRSGRKRSPMLTLASWLIFIAAILALANGIDGLIGGHPSTLDPSQPYIGAGQHLCSILFFVFGVVAMAGCVSAFLRLNYTLTLVGAAMGALGDGLIGAICGLLALAILFFADVEF